MRLFNEHQLYISPVSRELLPIKLAVSRDPDTFSLISEIENYVFENGRRYHRFQEGKYMMPNDETEQDRLDCHHHVFLLLQGGELCYSPVQNPKHILDIGTGTGIWALDAAETWPEAKVTGVDLSPIQPCWTFPNCAFEVDDVELEWTYPPNRFDLIYCRSMSQSIREWPELMKSFFRHTKPGGYTEFCEIRNHIQSDDDSLKPDSALAEFFDKWRQAAEKANVPTLEDTDFVRLLKEAGFVDITVRVSKQPTNPWPKDKVLKQAGRYMMVNTESAFVAYGMAVLTRWLGMSEAEVHDLCERARRDSCNPDIHAYNKIWHIVARKPLA
ncbi:S-adenosyl-L-methionine-dependent methyltransferase [Geopyxis carbonaria]|nr:S-adenosyl-L-methionine-dependent methyltransferase [Geopyxis carbonaria]